MNIKREQVFDNHPEVGDISELQTLGYFAARQQARGFMKPTNQMERFRRSIHMGLLNLPHIDVTTCTSASSLDVKVCCASRHETCARPWKPGFRGSTLGREVAADFHFLFFNLVLSRLATCGLRLAIVFLL